MTRKTILVVDDTPDHLDLLRRIFIAQGYHVISSAPGSDAMMKAHVNHPDLILAALSLPGQNAWETARQLSAYADMAHTPILGTTVYSTLLSIARVKAVGLQGYIEKPFDIDELLFRVQQLLTDRPRAAMLA